MHQSSAIQAGCFRPVALPGPAFEVRSELSPAETLGALAPSLQIEELKKRICRDAAWRRAVRSSWRKPKTKLKRQDGPFLKGLRFCKRSLPSILHRFVSSGAAPVPDGAREKRGPIPRPPVEPFPEMTLPEGRHDAGRVPGRARRVAILSSRLCAGQPACDEALGMYRLLEHRGHDVRLFAERCSSVPTSVSPPSALPAFLADAEAVLIYHHSEAWSQGLEAVRNACCKRIVKHHDVPTLHGVDVGGSHLGERVRAAHRHAEDLARLGCNRHLVPSLQTQRELIDRGVAIRNIHLVPDFHRLERVHGIEADVALLGDCRDGRVNVLCAGPLVPRRGQDVALAAFAAYHHRCNPDSRLVIVGAEEDYSRGYAGWLRRQAAVQGVKNAVVFAGAVSEAVLKSYYLAADVFLLTSADEGFCLRVLQAMALKVPVVAVGSTGVPDMLGQAGLVWQEPDVDVLAESIHALVEDKETAAALGFQAWERYQELFTNDRTAARFLHALEEFL